METDSKLQSLVSDAIESSKRRGHDMAVWHDGSLDSRPSVTLCCKECGMFATANSRPLPNEIDIGGSAVALNCPDNS